MEEDVCIIENTEDAQKDEFGCPWGGFHTILTEKHIEALRQGKQLAFCVEEYSCFLSMQPPVKSEREIKNKWVVPPTEYHIMSNSNP